MAPLTTDGGTPFLLGLLAILTALLFHDVQSWAIGVFLLAVTFGVAWIVSRLVCQRRRPKGGP